MRCEGHPALIEMATFMAQVLEIEGLSLLVGFSHEEPYISECLYYSNGLIELSIGYELAQYPETMATSVAHEMVHARQYHTGRLRRMDDYFFWGDIRYDAPEHMTDEYFLSPWEMEARALEAWVAHKWNERQDELHG